MNWLQNSAIMRSFVLMDRDFGAVIDAANTKDYSCTA